MEKTKHTRRGYTGKAGPYLVPLYQLALAADYIFDLMTFKEKDIFEMNARRCYIPNVSEFFIEELSKFNIVYHFNNGYHQISIMDHYISLHFLAYFLFSKKLPAIGTEILHYCNNKECLALGHISEEMWEQNFKQQSCYFEITKSEIIKRCFCSQKECTPLKFERNSVNIIIKFIFLFIAYLTVLSGVLPETAIYGKIAFYCPRSIEDIIQGPARYIKHFSLV